jgi:hypothetical protein
MEGGMRLLLPHNVMIRKSSDSGMYSCTLLMPPGYCGETRPHSIDDFEIHISMAFAIVSIPYRFPWLDGQFLRIRFGRSGVVRAKWPSEPFLNSENLTSTLSARRARLYFEG